MTRRDCSALRFPLDHGLLHDRRWLGRRVPQKPLPWPTEQPLVFADLMEKSPRWQRYVDMQCAAGIDALQIFDSWHSFALSTRLMSGPCDGLIKSLNPFHPDLPIILYAKASAGTGFRLLTSSKFKGQPGHEINSPKPANPSPPLSSCKETSPPSLMESSPDLVKKETNKLLNDMQGDPGHILNLGHGIEPQGKIECVHAMVEAARGFSLPKNNEFSLFSPEASTLNFLFASIRKAYSRHRFLKILKAFR